jgi:hypothetical protein
VLARHCRERHTSQRGARQHDGGKEKRRGRVTDAAGASSAAAAEGAAACRDRVLLPAATTSGSSLSADTAITQGAGSPLSPAIENSARRPRGGSYPLFLPVCEAPHVSRPAALLFVITEGNFGRDVPASRTQKRQHRRKISREDTGEAGGCSQHARPARRTAP